MTARDPLRAPGSSASVAAEQVAGGSRTTDMRLLPVAIAAWCVASIAILAPASAWLVASACVGLCAVCASVAWRRRRSAPRRRARARRWGAGAWAVAAVAVGIGAAVALHVALAQPARAAASERGGAHVEVTGVVETKVDLKASGLWFVLRTESIDGAGRHPLRAAVPVRVLMPPDAATGGNLDLGSHVTVAGGTREASPGAAEVFMLFAREAVVERDPPHVLGGVSFLRDAFAERAGTLPGPGGELLPGLAVGDTRYVSDELDDAMRVTSLAHLTAVSGANCAIVVGVAFAVSAALGAPRAVRIAAGLGCLVGFVLLVTPDASVIRAATMSAIAMLALLLGRTGAGVAVLSLAVAVLIALDPWRAFDFGFLLSVSATGALLLLAGPLARGLERFMPAPLALGLAVPLSAQLACGPIIVLFSPEVPVYGVLANLIAVPANPIVTVTGLIACLLVAVPALGVPAAWIAWLPSAWIGASAELFASLPYAAAACWEGWAGFFALAAIGACLSVLIVARPRGRGAIRALRVVSGGVLAVLVGAAAGGAAVTTVAAGPLTAPRDWVVAACEVGQGDAVLVRSGDQVALIDTGPDPEPLRACLNRLGVSRVDLLVITHFDLDHVGGVAALPDVGHVIHGPDGGRADAALSQLADAPRTEVAAGDRGMLGAAAWRVLWPAGDQRQFEPGNDTSVVLEMSGGGVPRSLFLGDLGEDSQSAMLRNAPLTGPYPIVKVAHHGSADQLDRLYVEASASLALVTVGENDYGHPRDEIVSLVEREGASVARTDVSGLVLVTSTPDGLSVWRERGG